MHVVDVAMQLYERKTDKHKFPYINKAQIHTELMTNTKARNGDSKQTQNNTQIQHTRKSYMKTILNA